MLVPFAAHFGVHFGAEVLLIVLEVLFIGHVRCAGSYLLDTTVLHLHIDTLALVLVGEALREAGDVQVARGLRNL